MEGRGGGGNHEYVTVNPALEATSNITVILVVHITTYHNCWSNSQFFFLTLSEPETIDFVDICKGANKFYLKVNLIVAERAGVNIVVNLALHHEAVHLFSLRWEL